MIQTSDTTEKWCNYLFPYGGVTGLYDPFHFFHINSGMEKDTAFVRQDINLFWASQECYMS